MVVLDPSFLKYRLFSASVERLATGFRWMEGPVWFGDGCYLLASDVANNRIIRWDAITGVACVFREASNYANGNTRDLQGRLVTCEGAVTRRISRTEHNGTITTLANNFRGKRFNSPNDLVCQSNGAIWFTDPPFQLSNDYEGRIAQQELPHAVYRIDGSSGQVTQVIDDWPDPTVCAFLRMRRSSMWLKAAPCPAGGYGPTTWVDGRLNNKTLHIDANGPGAFDGIKCDVDGNIWAGWGSNGALDADAAALDGVMVFNPEGKPIAHIRLPERCANLCFGGADNNRLFMASSHSLYALYVNTRGAEVRQASQRL